MRVYFSLCEPVNLWSFLLLLLVAFVQLASPSVESILSIYGTDRCSGEMKNESSSVLLLLRGHDDVAGNCVFPIIFEPI